jgi:hypothetical protein
MKFACFGGAAAVADEAVVFARQQTQSRRPRRRMKLLFGSNDDANSPSKAASKSKRFTSSPGRRDLDIYEMIAAADVAAGKLSRTSSVPSSSALSTAASLDSAYSSSSSISSCSSSRSSSSSASSLLEETPFPQPAKRRPLQPEEPKRSPAVGAAAVLVCLVMMMVGGRLAATLLTAAVLCFFPRQCPPAHRPTASKTSPDPAAALRREAIDAKAVMDGFLARNRNK